MEWAYFCNRVGRSFFEFNARFKVDQCYEVNTSLVQLLFILPMTIAID